MSGSRLQIWLDAERMKYPNTGLFHYCKELGAALAAEKSMGEELTFYLPAKYDGCFGKGVKYVHQQLYHKWFLPTPGMDVWHSMQQDSDYFPRNQGKQLVLTVHDLNFLHQPGKSRRDVKTALGRLQKRVNRAAQIVTISEFVLRELRENLDLGTRPAQVIYNGCNFSAVHSSEPKAIIHRPFLFTIGTISAKKNFHVLPALLLRNDYRLVIAGVIQDESYLAKIKLEAQRLGVAERLVFTGAIPEEEKQWYYSNCLAFVFPSLAEGFGMPVLEAMYFGKPVFLSTHTSLPEIGGRLVYYFESFDADHLQEVLEQGLHHYSTNSPEESIRAHALSFSWQTAARQYLDIYRRIVG